MDLHDEIMNITVEKRKQNLAIDEAIKNNKNLKDILVAVYARGYRDARRAAAEKAAQPRVQADESGSAEKIVEMTHAKGWSPYRNRLGHWVWQMPDDKSYPDLTWPGLKPPSKTAIPVWENDGWYWQEPQ